MFSLLSILTDEIPQNVVSFIRLLKYSGDDLQGNVSSTCGSFIYQIGRENLAVAAGAKGHKDTRPLSTVHIGEIFINY